MNGPECIDRARKQQPDLKLIPIIPLNTIHVDNNLMNSISDPIYFLLECPDCENGTCDSCPLHHIWKTMPSNGGGLDKPSKRFTSVPIPTHWRVQKSSIRGAGLGVFARTHVPCGTRMGPYRGERKMLSSNRRACSSSDMCYAWEIKRNGRVVGIVDGKNPSMSNFMRYINCACYESQQNMVAYQYDGQIYYRSVKDIAVGEELLVWYGHEYGKELGLLNTSMTMSLGPLTKSGKTSRRKPAKNNFNAQSGVIPRRRSHRSHHKAVAVVETELSKGSNEGTVSLLQGSVASPRAAEKLLSRGQGSRRQGRKRPVQNSVTPHTSKRTNPPPSPSLNNYAMSQNPTLRDGPSHLSGSATRLPQSSQLTTPSSSVRLEESDGHRRRSTPHKLRHSVQSTGAQPTKRSSLPVSPPSTLPVSTLGENPDGSNSRQPDAVAQLNKTPPASMLLSPLENSINLILSSAAEDKPSSAHRSFPSCGSAPLKGGRQAKRKRTLSRRMPLITTQQRLMKPTLEAVHPCPAPVQEVLLSPPRPSPQSISTPPYTNSVATRPVATSSSDNLQLPHTQTAAKVTLPSPLCSSSMRKSSVAPASADTKSHIQDETASPLQIPPVAMGQAKDEPFTDVDTAPHNTPSQLVVDNIHNSDLFLIVRPRSDAPSPAISYCCRVSNGHFVLTDVGPLAHSCTPQVGCNNNESPGNVKKSLKIPCVFCDDLLSSRGALYAHIKTTHRHKLGKYPYYCSICHKGYKTSLSLWGHLRVHLDVGPKRGCSIKQKLSVSKLVQKEGVFQSGSGALGSTAQLTDKNSLPEPSPSPLVPFTVEPASQSEDDTEIVSVGSQEFPSGPELAEDSMFVQKVSRRLQHKKRIGKPTKRLTNSPLMDFLPTLFSSSSVDNYS